MFTIKKLGQLNQNKLFNIIFYVILTQKVVADSQYIVGKVVYNMYSSRNVIVLGYKC